MSADRDWVLTPSTTNRPTNREHGTLAMRRRGECATDPCDACLEEGRRYERRRTKLKTMGRNPYVDATRARAYVQQLLAGGMTVRQVEAASGVHRTAIRVMLGDFPRRARSERIRPGTERALLDVRVDLGPCPEGTATVDAVGTRRRLEALQAIGYPARWLAHRLGSAVTSPLQIATQSRVRASTARAVGELYAELENTPGPSRRAAVAAQARGFLTPAWWDTDTIDDPNARLIGVGGPMQDAFQTEAGWVRVIDNVTLPRLERIERLQSHGLTNGEIADRLGIPVRYVSRDLLTGRRLKA